MARTSAKATAGRAKKAAPAAAKKPTKQGGRGGGGRGAASTTKAKASPAPRGSRKALGTRAANVDDTDEESVVPPKARGRGRAKKEVSYEEESSEESGEESDYSEEEEAPKKKKKKTTKGAAGKKKKATAGKPPRAPKPAAKGKKGKKLQPSKDAVGDLLAEVADEADSPVNGDPSLITRFTQKMAHDHPAQRKGASGVTPKGAKAGEDEYGNVIAGGGTERKASMGWQEEYEPQDDWRVTTVAGAW